MHIKVTDKVAGFHRWPNAPVARKYLSYPHEHDFTVSVYITVTEEDREVEFHDVRTRLHHILTVMGGRHCNSVEPFLDFETLSCEAIARKVLTAMPEVCKCEVHEDEFGGAIYERETMTVSTSLGNIDVDVSEPLVEGIKISPPIDTRISWDDSTNGYTEMIANSIRDHGLTISYTDRPTIITLCGSIRFKEQFLYQQQQLEECGYFVHSLEFPWPNDPPITSRGKEMLDWVHKEKIRDSDEILVINVDGYIGESTASEIKYAETLGKKITYLEPCGE
jgi:6-pyruvoyl-tetrahydropterin synthase